MLSRETEAELQRERLELDREWVRETATCPTCGAELGQRCRTNRTGQPKVGNHRVRNELAVVGPTWKRPVRV
jgi:hypothetical protein